MLAFLFAFFPRLLIFFKINVFEKFFEEYHQSVKQFGSRSGSTFCRAQSGSKLLNRLSVDDASRQRVKCRDNFAHKNVAYLELFV